MATHSALACRQFRNVVIMMLAVAFAGLSPQVVEALDFTSLEITSLGNDHWYLEGFIDAVLDIDEHAEIVLGGDISATTSTTAGGAFEYFFEGYIGDLITVKASFAGDESETESRILVDPTSGPARTLDR